MILHDKDLARVCDAARRSEALGASATWVTEAGTEPFLHALQAVQGTTRIPVGTAVAIAFARSPAIVAQAAWEIAGLSGGRFWLGLGTQVKAHIARRYNTYWSGRPVEQMRDYIEALEAIWATWRTGQRLSYQGRHYAHTLMPDFFHPLPHSYDIPVWLAAVGPGMVELAAEKCAGVALHPFSNRAYRATYVRDALERGRSRSKLATQFEVSLPLFMVMGDTEEEIERERANTVTQLAFYGSTPSYRPVLEAVGAGDVQSDLHSFFRSGRTPTIPAEIGDLLIEHFALVGTPEQMPELAAAATAGDPPTRVSSYSGWPHMDDDRLRAILARFP